MTGRQGGRCILLGDRATAEDLVQDTFVRFVMGRADVRDPEKAEALLYTYLKPGRIRVEQVIGDLTTPTDVQARIASGAPGPGTVVRYPDLRTQIHEWTTQSWWLKEQLQPSPAQLITAHVNHDSKASAP